MPDWLVPILIVILLSWVAQSWFSYWMLEQVRTLVHKQYQCRLPKDEQNPAAVIVPFKGCEPGLENNIAGLFKQNYAEYRLLFVVESADDEVVPFLHQAIAENNSHDAQVIVAGFAGGDEGQKVHNLIAAIEWLDAHDQNTEFLVFADSDAVAGPLWLADLTGPLKDLTNGCTTGYRWLFPVNEKGGKPTMAASFASAMNSSAITFYRRKRWRRAWGGSMAMRRQTATEGDLIGAMRGSVSDDLSVHRMMSRMGLQTYFEHRCLIRSDVVFNWATLWNFGTRQHTIIRCMDVGTFWRTFWIPWLYILGMLTAWIVLIVGVWVQPSMSVCALIALVAVAVGNQVRANTRRKLIVALFGEASVHELNNTLRVDRWMTWGWVPYHGLVMLKAACSRTIVWRGNRYKLEGPNQTRQLP